MSKSENTPVPRRPSGTSAGAPNHGLKKKFSEGGVPDSWTLGTKFLFINRLGVHEGRRLWTVPWIGKGRARGRFGHRPVGAVSASPLPPRRKGPPLFFHYFKRYRGVTVKFPVILTVTFGDRPNTCRMVKHAPRFHDPRTPSLHRLPPPLPFP